MPGMTKMTSTTTAPPMSVPKLRPATVSRVRLDGRSAWRQRMRRSEMPFARAMVMKSSCSVAIMSLRSRRMYTAISPAASEIAGRSIVAKWWPRSPVGRPNSASSQPGSYPPAGIWPSQGKSGCHCTPTKYASSEGEHEAREREQRERARVDRAVGLRAGAVAR